MLGVGSYSDGFYQLFTLKADDINPLHLFTYLKKKHRVQISHQHEGYRWQGQLREDGQLLPNAALLVRVPMGVRLRNQH